MRRDCRPGSRASVPDAHGQEARRQEEADRGAVPGATAPPRKGVAHHGAATVFVPGENRLVEEPTGTRHLGAVLGEEVAPPRHLRGRRPRDPGAAVLGVEVAHVRDGAHQTFVRAPEPQVPVLAGGQVGIEADVERQRGATNDGEGQRHEVLSQQIVAARARGPRRPPRHSTAAWSTTCHVDAATTSPWASRKSRTVLPTPGNQASSSSQNATSSPSATSRPRLRARQGPTDRSVRTTRTRRSWATSRSRTSGVSSDELSSTTTSSRCSTSWARTEAAARTTSRARSCVGMITLKSTDTAFSGYGPRLRTPATRPRPIQRRGDTGRGSGRRPHRLARTGSPASTPPGDGLVRARR